MVAVVAGIVVTASTVGAIIGIIMIDRRGRSWSIFVLFETVSVGVGNKDSHLLSLYVFNLPRVE